MNLQDPLRCWYIPVRFLIFNHTALKDEDTIGSSCKPDGAFTEAVSLTCVWAITGVSTLCFSLQSMLLQDGMVQSAKEAFEAMSASGGWSVYTNSAARRISDGGNSSGLTHEVSL